jgi:hypothetical protein
MIDQHEPMAAQPQSTLSRDAQRALGGAALYLIYFACITLFNAQSLHLPVQLLLIVAVLSTVSYLVILVYAIRLLCAVALPARVQTWLMLGSLLLFLGLNPIVWQVVRALRKGPSLTSVLQALTPMQGYPLLDVIVPFFLILAGVYAGQLLARIVRERAILLPVAVVSGMIDFWGVYWGFVNKMSESAPAAVSYMASASTAAVTMSEEIKATLPQSMQFVASIAPPDSIGIGDFVFLAFFLTCAYRLGFSVARTMWGIFAGLLLATLIIALEGQTLFGHTIVIDYLPGLVFICGGVLVANWRSWQLQRQEWAMTGVVVVLLAGLIGVSIYRDHQQHLAERQAMQEQQIDWQESEFTLPDSTAADALVRSVEQLSAGTQPQSVPAEPVFAQVLYRKNDGGYRAVQWRIFAIARPTPLRVDATRAMVLIGKQVTQPHAEWRITQLATSPPPDDFLGIVTADVVLLGDRLTALRAVEPLPMTAFAQLATAQQHLTDRPDAPQTCLLELRSGNAKLFGATKTMPLLNEWTYP